MRLVNLEILDYLLFHRKILNYRLIWPYWVSAIVGSVVGGDEHHNDAGEVFVVMLGRQARQQHERSATPVFYSEAESSSNPALTTNGHCVLCPSVSHTSLSSSFMQLLPISEFIGFIFICISTTTHDGKYNFYLFLN